MTASASTIARIKEAVPLVDIVGQYVKLRKFKSDFLGLCPFHSEETPSFRVHPTWWKCFGCGKAGDVFDFLVAIDGISFHVALARLSERTGIPLDGKPRTRLQRVYDRQESEFAEWWHQRQVELLELRLSAMVSRLNCEFLGATETECDEVGSILMRLRAMKRSQWVAVAQRSATSYDRRAWDSDRKYWAALRSLACYSQESIVAFMFMVGAYVQ